MSKPHPESWGGISRVTKQPNSGTVWKVGSQRVITPYAKFELSRSRTPSTTGLVKSCGNLGGPSSKAKYYLMTDSEPVP